MILDNETQITGSNKQEIYWSYFVNPLWFVWPLFYTTMPYYEAHTETAVGYREQVYWEKATWSAVEIFKHNQTNVYYSRLANYKYGSFIK